MLHFLVDRFHTNSNHKSSKRYRQKNLKVKIEGIKKVPQLVLHVGNAYKVTLHWSIKRSPFNRKQKKGLHHKVKTFVFQATETI